MHDSAHQILISIVVLLQKNLTYTLCSMHSSLLHKDLHCTVAYDQQQRIAN